MRKKLLLLALSMLWAVPCFAQQVDTAWVRRYSGPGSHSDYASTMTMDKAGNVYVTGESYGSGTSYDYATIKYDSLGNQLWVRRYDGPVSGADSAYAIVVDNSGNASVTGQSYSGTSDDYATVKYDPSGNQLWVQRYNGPGNSDDVANAIAIDNLRNVYVTGYSFESGTGFDFATIKYYPNGDTAWVRRYNGPASGADYAYAIVVDNSGNAYVTGQSWGSGTSDDYATIKYDLRETNSG